MSRDALGVGTAESEKEFVGHVTLVRSDLIDV